MALFDLKQSGQKSGLSPDQLEWLIRRGRLRATQPGGPRGKWYVQEDDLEALLRPAQAVKEQKE